MEKLKVGIVGLGYWGPNLLRNLYTVKGVEVALACDINERRIRAIQERYPSQRFTTRYADLIEDPEIRAIVIATPVRTHYELAKAALEAGKDVFVEKPMTLTSQEAEKLIELAESSGRVLMVGHTFIYNPAVRKIKALIESGELGRIYYITSTRVNLGIHRHDVDVLWDLASHDFSILLYWLDREPEKIWVVAKDFILNGIPDVAFIQLVYPEDLIVNIQVGWLAPAKVRNVVIVGSRKMVMYDDTDPYMKVKVFDTGVDFKEPMDYGEFQLTYRTGDVLAPKLDTREPLRIEMEHFIECVRTRKRPLTDGYAGLRVVRMLEEAAEASRNGTVQSVEPSENLSSLR